MTYPYRPLPEKKYLYTCACDSADSRKEIASKMHNSIGFENTRWFRIVNAFDNSVVELQDNKLITSQLDPSKEDCQTFVCSLTEAGHFEIRAQRQGDESSPMVWDYLSHNKLLVQRKRNAAAKRSNQNWISETVPGSVSTYFIISAPDLQKCLKNMGIGNQIKIVEKTDEVIGDKSVHWKLVMLEPVQS